MRSAIPGCAGGGEERTTYEYDGLGRRSKEYLPNHTKKEYTYDAATGYLDTITHKKADGAVLLSLDYDRYASGQIEHLTETRSGQTGAKWHYTYDAQKRLTDATRETLDENPANDSTYHYDYDAAGNRTGRTVTGAGTTSYTYNRLDQLIADGTYTYEYDAYGNLAAKKQGAAVLDEYTWDCENHLVGATIRNTSGQPLRTLEFTYDGQGTRVRRTLTDGETPANNAATKYLTDYMNPTGYSQTLQELNLAGGDVQAQYAYDDSGVLSQETAGGESSYFHGDHLGSTRLLTDGAGSAISDSTYDYEPYGDPISGSGSLTSYRFTGQYRDSALGLQYHRARWLNTSTASWLSTDPVFDFPTNFGSTYGYGGCSPLHLIDNSGTFLAECLAVAVLVAGFVAYACIAPMVTVWTVIGTALAWAAIAFLLAVVIEFLVCGLSDTVGISDSWTYNRFFEPGDKAYERKAAMAGFKVMIKLRLRAIAYRKLVGDGGTKLDSTQIASLKAVFEARDRFNRADSLFQAIPDGGITSERIHEALGYYEDRSIIMIQVPGGVLQSPVSKEAMEDLVRFGEEGFLSKEDLEKYRKGVVDSYYIWDKVDKQIDKVVDPLFDKNSTFSFK